VRDSRFGVENDFLISACTACTRFDSTESKAVFLNLDAGYKWKRIPDAFRRNYKYDGDIHNRAMAEEAESAQLRWINNRYDSDACKFQQCDRKVNPAFIVTYLHENGYTLNSYSIRKIHIGLMASLR